jgi:hypothetical protein
MRSLRALPADALSTVRCCMPYDPLTAAELPRPVSRLPLKVLP